MSRHAPWLLPAWLGLLALLAWLAVAQLNPSGDLRLFLPEARDARQALLLDSLGEGPGSRMLLLAVSGAQPEALAEASRELAVTLSDVPGIRRVANGEHDLDALPDALLPARYLLSPGFDDAPLDTATLRAQLRARLQDLGSPAASLVEPWVGRDPTLEVLRLAERWAPAQEPDSFDGVWFDADTTHALLVVEGEAAAFDTGGQQGVVDAIAAAFAQARTDLGGDLAQARLEVSGPGAFSVLMRSRTQGEATRLGLFAGLGMVIVLGLAYRRLRAPLLAALPLASGILAGLAAVALQFDGVHGITLAFGITLIGIAQDYPIHLFSHRRPGEDSYACVRGLWPTLLTGVLSTCLAFGSFFVSGVEGLHQLAVFSITGLLTAALCTRFALPALLGDWPIDPARQRWTLGVWRQLDRLRGVALVLPLLALAGLSWLLVSPQPMWDDRLGGLTPVPVELLERDGELRRQLGVADVRHVLAVEGADLQALLERSEALEPVLEALVQRGALEGFELPSHLLPSAAVQRQRQQRLPGGAALRGMLAEAREGLPFRAQAFSAFEADVARAREMAPLEPADFDDTPLQPRLEAALRAGPPGSPALGLASLTGVRDVAAIAAALDAQGDDVWLMDLQAAAETLSSAWRVHVLWALGGAVIVLCAALAVALRSVPRAARVLAPVALAGLLLAALLNGFGVSFTLFHLVAAILAAGLGLDYALFFERARHDRSEARRTLHAIVLCAVSTCLVFGLLGTSSIPVLRAIGVTVALGVVLNLVLAAIVAGRAVLREEPDDARA